MPGFGDPDARPDVISHPVPAAIGLNAGENVEAGFEPIVDSLRDLDGFVLGVIGRLKNWTADDQPPSVKINEESVKWGDLHDQLFDVFKQRAEKVLFVKGDDEVDFEYVADAISIARDSGVERVGLLTKTGPEMP
jgi:hypothetical protein